MSIKFRLLLAPVVIFFGLELVLWLFVRTPLEPLKRIDLTNALPGLKSEVRVKFDRNLTRYLDDKSEDKPAGTIRILCLGGSGTFALFQNAEDAWWGQLGRRLQAKGHQVEVAAWGQDRTGIVASLPIAATILEEWKPDVVIGSFGFDDVVGQPLDYQYQPEKARGLPGPPRTAGWKQAILQVSQIARLGRKWARANDSADMQNRFGRPDHWKEVFENMKKQVSELPAQALPARDSANDPVNEFADGWEVLKEMCDRRGAALIVTGEPALEDSTNNLTQEQNLTALVPLKREGGPDARFVRPEPVWVEREMNRYAEAAERFASGAKVPWLNLNGRVPRDLEHFFSDVILTDKGSSQMAAELLPVVEPVVAKLEGK